MDAFNQDQDWDVSQFVRDETRRDLTSDIEQAQYRTQQLYYILMLYNVGNKQLILL